MALSVHASYFSPLSPDTGGGRAGSGSVSRAQAAGTGPGPWLSDVTQGLAAAVRMPWGGGSRSRRWICRPLANPPRGLYFLGVGGGKGNLTPEGQGAASAHPHGTGWPGECAWARAQRAEAEVRRKVLPGTQELAPHRQTPAGGLCGGLGLHLGDYPGFESVMRCGGDVTWETVPGLGARGHGAGIGGAGCRLAVGLTCSWRPQPVCGTPGTRFHPL